MRPYFHKFLSAAHSEYDIMIWSATGMKWVELKMGQLEVLSNPNYKIIVLLDRFAMITLCNLKSSLKRKLSTASLLVSFGPSSLSTTMKRKQSCLMTSKGILS